MTGRFHAFPEKADPAKAAHEKAVHEKIEDPHGRKQMARLPLLIVMVMASGLIGCAIAGDAPREHASGDANDVGPGSAAMLLGLAEQDLDKPARPTEVAPPPMISQHLLEPATSPRAEFSRSEALRRIADDAPIPLPEPRDEIDADRKDEALCHYIKGRDAAAGDQHLVAVMELRRALEIDPGAPEIMRQLARSYRESGNAGQSSLMYEAMLDVAPNDPEAILWAALAKANGREFQRTLELLARVLGDGGAFTFDPAAPVIADFTQAIAFRELGYERAFIESAYAALDLPERLSGPTRFGPHLNSITAQQGELWRSIGDAHLRLGAYDQAMEAYGVAAAGGQVEEASIHPRMVYTMLASGRPYAAQQYFLEVVLDGDDEPGEDDVRLARYLKDNGDDVELLARAVADRHRENPEEPILLRMTAALVPPDRAESLLREAVLDQPLNRRIMADVFAQMFESAGDAAPDAAPDAALALAEDLAAEHPQHSFIFAEELARQAPDPYVLLLQMVDRAPGSAHESGYDSGHEGRAAQTTSMLRIGVAVYAGATGRAWEMAGHALAAHPDGRLLPVARIHLAAAMEDAALIDEVIAESPDAQSPIEHRARATAYRVVNRLDEALEAAEKAVELDPDDPVSVVTLARVHAARVLDAEEDGERDEAIDALEHAVHRGLELQPHSTEVFDVLLEVFGPGAPQYDRSTFAEIVRRLQQTHRESGLYSRLVARDEIARGRYDAALERALPHADRDPTDEEVLALTVTAWIELQRFDDAERWLEARLERRPGNPALLEQWSRLLAEQGRIAPVEDRLTKLLDEHPGHPVALQTLEKTYRAAGRTDDVVRIGRKRQEAMPPSISRDLRLAALDARDEAVAAAQDRLRSILQRADRATAEQLLTAIDLSVRFELDAIDNELSADLARTYLDAGHTPYFVVSGIKLRAMARQGITGEQFDAVLGRAVERSVQQDGRSPAHVTEWSDLAQGLFDEGFEEPAARVLERRLLAGPDVSGGELAHLLTAYLLAAGSADAGAGEIIDVLEDVVDVRGKRPHFAGMPAPAEPADVFFEAATLLYTVGRESAAEAMYLEVLDRDDAHAMAMNNLGYKRLTDGRDDETTRELIEQAHELEPDDPHVTDSIGWLRYKQGRFERHNDEPGAVELLERAAERSDGDAAAEVLDHLGDALWRIGREDDAVAAWERALSIITDASHRREFIDNLNFAQFQVWGLVVADSESLYDQRYGPMREQLERKLDRAASGETPPIAETFAEQGRTARSP